MNPLNLLKYVSLFPVIVSAVRSVERMVAKGTSSADKQQAAIDLIQDFAPFSQLGVGPAALQDDRVQQALRAAVDAVVAVENALRAASGGQVAGSPTTEAAGAGS